MPEVNKMLCIGCGTCVSMCPHCFEIDSDGKAECTCKDDCSSSCNIDDVISGCPVEAISK